MPAEALAGVQDAAALGPVVEEEQVVAVYWLPAAAATGVHEATRVGPVVAVEQEILPPGVQLATGVVSSVAASYLRIWLVD